MEGSHSYFMLCDTFCHSHYHKVKQTDTLWLFHKLILQVRIYTYTQRHTHTLTYYINFSILYGVLVKLHLVGKFNFQLLMLIVRTVKI